VLDVARGVLETSGAALRPAFDLRDLRARSASPVARKAEPEALKPCDVAPMRQPGARASDARTRMSRRREEVVTGRHPRRHVERAPGPRLRADEPRRLAAGSAVT
jgi:hypothetical protein